MAKELTIYAQFAHLNSAALRPARTTRGKDKNWSASQLLAEADRIPGNASHVEHPLPPNWLKGSRKLVEARAAAWREQAREAGGKARLRATSPSLACAVVSWPRAREAEWGRYRDSVIAHFKTTVGDERIPGVVEHLDESNQHIHVYFVPLDGEGFGVVHPGYAARVQARQSPGNHVRVAYVQAMKRWQDELYASTGEPHGLMRVGPKRERLSRSDHTARKRAADIKESADTEAAEVLARAREIQRQAEERLAMARRADSEVMRKVELLRHAQVRLAETPAGVLEAELLARDAELTRLREQIASLNTDLDAAQFRNREHDKRAAITPPRRPPTPFD